MAHLALDEKMVDRCRQMAARIAKPVEQMINTHTTVAIERAVLRLLGVEGAVKQGGQWYHPTNGRPCQSNFSPIRPIAA